MDEQTGWRYYKNAMIPASAPHEPVDLSSLKEGQLWKQNPKALLARWTTDFDCEQETNWWYVIKDTPLDLAALKSKRRYEINKGLRNFDIKVIRPEAYGDELFAVTVAAYSSWPEAYRPQTDRDRFLESLKGWRKFRVFGGFSRENGKLCAYAMLDVREDYADFAVLRVMPEYESQAVNAAMVYGIVKDQEPLLNRGGYICDGSRSISHETAFQDYLEKYFGFRKAYCKLYIQYRPGVNGIVMCLRPFEKLMKRLDRIGIVHKINSVLAMEAFAEK